jgi:2-polyprenyl-3-methyl-5-hydroxy-6-metoxy-1,4-benzoquinol methylase
MRLRLLPSNTDKAWEYFGATEPYYSVGTYQEFRSDNLNPAAREKFFQSGKQHIDRMLQIVHTFLDPAFAPKRSLDFGCGVGRLVVPLGALSESVVGADVSASMLAEAQQNCKQYGIENATLIASDDTLSNFPGSFNFIHSFIVFQHIPPSRGVAIMRGLIDRLEEGGIGILHFTYSKQPTMSRSMLLRRWAYGNIPYLFNLRNLFRGRPFSEPMMQMYEYNVNQLLNVLMEKGCHQCHLRFTMHGHHGVILFFRKQSMQML